MSDLINLCFVDMMHQCSFKHWDQQKHCQFGEKNSHCETCTDLRMDRWCSCQDAYPTAKTVRVKAEDLPKIVERGEEEVWGISVIEQIRRAEKALDEADVPIENRMLSEYAMVPAQRGSKAISPPRTEFVDRRYFIEATKHYIMCDLEEMGYGGLFSGIKHRERLDELMFGSHVTFVLGSKYGDIYQELILPNYLKEEDAKTFGSDIAHIAIEHYKRLEEKQYKIKPGRMMRIDTDVRVWS